MTYRKKIITFGRRLKQCKEKRAKKGSMRQEKSTHHTEPIFAWPGQTIEEALLEEQTIIEELLEERVNYAVLEDFRKEEAREKKRDKYSDYAYCLRH